MSAELSAIIDKNGLPAVKKLLGKADFDPGKCVFSTLKGDGSDRKFIRVESANSSVIVILPGGQNQDNKLEARSVWLIGRHLHKSGVPVPEMFSHDSVTGAILCEDLGETLFHQHIQGMCEEELTGLYEEVIDILVNMQIKGAEGFTADMCWDQSVYDRQTMLERESGYFLDSCCIRFLGKNVLLKDLAPEFSDLADLAEKQPAKFFLHRDFQSRNIMVNGGNLRLIDFQGGRFGPLAYDLASLLIDPYVQLSDKVRENLLEYYYDRASDVVPMSRDEFLEGYTWLAIQRNLQILGAFAFLSLEKGKSFFGQFLYPASVTLKDMLDDNRKNFPILRIVTSDLVAHLQEHVFP